MQILKRYKNADGKTVQYLIERDGLQEIYPALAVLEFYNNLQITNAIMLPNGEFKARDGFHIDTEVYAPQLLINRAEIKASAGVVTKDSLQEDYFGKTCIKACKKIRYCALADEITIDMHAHKTNGGRNIHLFNLIKACGISVYDFIVGYLSELQPYALTPYHTDGGTDSIWICEIGYKTTMLIKLQRINGQKPVVLSFHESNLDGRNRKIQTDFTQKACAVIVDNVKQVAGKYIVDYTIRKGFLRYAMQSVTSKYSKGIALVNYREIKQYLDVVLQDRLEELSVQYYGANSTFLPELAHAQNVQADKLSFLSYGFSTVNTICMLVDLFSTTTNAARRLMLTDLAEQVFTEATVLRQAEIVVGLQEKFQGTNALERI